MPSPPCWPDASVTPRHSAPEMRHPWVAALLLGTLVTPAAVVLAWLAPRPLDLVVAWPLVVVDIWAASGGRGGAAGTPTAGSPFGRLLLLMMGIGLTWLFYILLARLAVRRWVPRAGDDGAAR